MHHSVPSRSPRDLSTDTLRGLACLALVSFHVVGMDPYSGMELPQGHALVRFNALFADMRMPLFTFLSGFVFIALERSTRTPGQLVAAKVRRLFVPLLSVGALFWAAQWATGRAPMPLYWIPVLPLGHFWFLQAVLVIMCLFIVLKRLTDLNSAPLAAGLLVISAVWWLIGPRAPVDVFSINQVRYLMPFFMLGYLCAHIRRGDPDRLRLSARTALGILAVATCLSAVVVTLELMPHQIERRVLTLLIGGATCLALIAWAPQHRFLAWIGAYSYGIYLFHVFFTAAAQDLLFQPLADLPVLGFWGLGVVVGVTGPILLQRALLQRAWLASLFLGLRWPNTQVTTARDAPRGTPATS